ncbi:hypothetical protein ES708_27489 [subsurface metagenome]
MVKIVNTLGEVKTGVQGEAVYQGRYGQQIRRTRQPKRAIPSQKQLEHRQLYREALTWRKGLSLPNRRYLDGYCISNWIVDDHKIALPWSRFALKLYLQHISFAMVDKPIMVYLPAYEEHTEEQTERDTSRSIGNKGLTHCGQRLTIANRKVNKLGFWLSKVGTPPGVYFYRILKASNKSEIYSQQAGVCNDLTTSPVYTEITLNTPQELNDEVIIAVEDNEENTSNYINVDWKYADVKPSEYMTDGYHIWTDRPDWDCAYRYKYLVELPPGEAGYDYENSTKGLLHIRHPALLSGEHRRDGKLLESWTNLSNLDEEYLTGQVGVDVFSADEFKFTTIAGLEYSFRVP